LAKNKQKTKLKGKDLTDKKVLILGESGSGKTKMAATLFQELMTLANPETITVIDLAPERIGEIGGKLTDYVSLISGVKYLSPKKVYMPRLAGTSPTEVLHYAKLNRKNIEPLLNSFIQQPTKVLVINDVTLYFHSGEFETVLKCVRLAQTFLATAYYGSKLSEDLGTGISSREREMTDKFATFMDLVVKIH